jgi:hypothetical protein
MFGLDKAVSPLRADGLNTNKVIGAVKVCCSETFK